MRLFLLHLGIATAAAVKVSVGWANRPLYTRDVPNDQSHPARIFNDVVGTCDSGNPVFEVLEGDGSAQESHYWAEGKIPLLVSLREEYSGLSMEFIGFCPGKESPIDKAAALVRKSTFSLLNVKDQLELLLERPDVRNEDEYTKWIESIGKYTSVLYEIERDLEDFSTACGRDGIEVDDVPPLLKMAIEISQKSEDMAGVISIFEESEHDPSINDELVRCLDRAFDALVA